MHELNDNNSDEDAGEIELLEAMSGHLKPEIDINNHLHCNNCIKLKKCQERPKPGWSCEIIDCKNGCGYRFHDCKTIEHNLLCSNIKVACINAGNGCPFIIARKSISNHLLVCPASVIICNAEWNRWAIGAKERERTTPAKGASALFDSNDLDLCFAINDQKMVNDMHCCPKYVRRLMCNDINKRFPSLPLTVRGSHHEDRKRKFLKDCAKSISTTDDEEELLAPGLSLSVCTELVKGQKKCENESYRPTNSDDISARCCAHFILKDLCHLCRDDPDVPECKYGTVWRDSLDLSFPSLIQWTKEPRIEKIRRQGPLGHFAYQNYEDLEDSENEEEKSPSIDLPRPRFQTPPPAPLTPKGLILELGLKHLSRHQVKPKAMFTFQCMQEVRRDQFESHYKNVHSEIQEGLDGWLLQRCPLHIIGCPFSITRMFPGKQAESEVIYCNSQRGFGILHDRCATDSKSGDHSRSPSMEKSSQKSKMDPIPEDGSLQFLASSAHITTLPFEVLQRIARHLDGFSLNNLSLTCHLFRDVCFSQIDEKGLVIQEWIRHIEQGRVRWKLGTNRWFFSKCFKPVQDWRFKNEGEISNHLTVCPFNDRTVPKEKFSYIPKFDLIKAEDILSIYNKYYPEL